MVADAGGVQYGPDRVALGGHPGDEPGDRVAVGDVAGDDGHPRPQLGQETARLGALGAGAADEHEVVRALGGQPAGQVRADPSGPAGDQDRTAGLPASVGGGSGGGGAGSDEPPAEDARGPDGDLVLADVPVPGAARTPAPGVSAASGAARTPGDEGAEAVVGGVVGLGRQIGEPAPAARVLQGGNPAETPDLGLGGVGDGLGAVDGDRTARHAPEPGLGFPLRLLRGLGLGLGERLDQPYGSDQTGGGLGAAGVRPPVEAQQ
ncbi:Uncharacterised protein [Streptomyces griseus]|nr:Uncharacterised protein [Streptomyces griseus]